MQNSKGCLHATRHTCTILAVHSFTVEKREKELD